MYTWIIKHARRSAEVYLVHLLSAAYRQFWYRLELQQLLSLYGLLLFRDFALGADVDTVDAARKTSHAAGCLQIASVI